MKHFPVDLSVDAASCALRCGNVPHALELLEQGRALLWTQQARFHILLDDLRTSDPRGVQAILSYDEFRWIPEHLDYSRLKQRARQKSTLEKVTKTLVVKGACCW
jgi:hypothetical protein